MLLDIYYIPSVVKSLYAEEDSAFYYVNPFEHKDFGKSSICTTDTSPDVQETPDRGRVFGYYSQSRFPDNPGRAKFSTGSSQDSEFYLKKQRVDFERSPVYASDTSLDITETPDRGGVFGSGSEPCFPDSPGCAKVDLAAGGICFSRKRARSSESSEASGDRGSNEHERQRPSRDSLDDRRPFKKLPYTCQRCGKSYKWPSNLRRHLKTHQDAANFPRETCAEEPRIRMPNQQPNACLHCVKHFQRRGNLIRHHAEAHSSCQSLHCDIYKLLKSEEDRMESYRKRKRLSEAPLHCREKRGRTTEFDHSMHFSRNASGDDAGTEATFLHHRHSL